MRVGQKLGKYQIKSLYRSGGMADIYEAVDPLNRRLAIKVLRIDEAYASSSDLEARQKLQRQFQSEIRLIATFDHPHILALFDHFEDFYVDPPQIYMVMPFQQQGSLGDWLKRRKQSKAPALPFVHVARLVAQAADALQYVHDRDIVHQDVKPQNFLLRDSTHQLNLPDILLSDFGISKSITSQPHTKPLGTAHYMAPEQWDSQPVFASDQYSLACMAYELLTGNPPFQGNLTDLIMQHLNYQPTPPSVQNSALPNTCDAVILRALAKKPEDRFPSVFEFASALSKVHNAGTSTVELSNEGSIALQPSPTPAPFMQRLPVRSLWIFLSLIFLVTGLLFGGAGGFLVGRSVTPPATPKPVNNSAIVSAAVAATQTASASVSATALPGQVYTNATGTQPFLQDNMQSDSPAQDTGRWEEIAGKCYFDRLYYQVVAAATSSSSSTEPDFQACQATLPTLNLADFVFQINMIVESGSSGGILFDMASSGSSFYYFRLLNGHAYEFGASDNGSDLHELGSGSSHVLPASLAGTTITLTVIATINPPAMQHTFYFYVNIGAGPNTYIFQINQAKLDGYTYTSGYPGALAFNESSVEFWKASVTVI